MIKDIIKLVIAMWVVKRFIFDNSLLVSVIKAIKQRIEGLSPNRKNSRNNCGKDFSE